MVGDADGVKAGIASLSCSACAVLAAGTASARNSDCDGPAPVDCSSEGEPASRLPVILSKNPMLLFLKTLSSSFRTWVRALLTIYGAPRRTAEEARVALLDPGSSTFSSKSDSSPKFVHGP